MRNFLVIAALLLALLPNTLLAQTSRERPEPRDPQPVPKKESVDFHDLPKEIQDLHNIVNKLRGEGRMAEAEPVARKLLAVTRKTFREDSGWIAFFASMHAGVLCDLGRHPDAEPLYLESLKIYEAHYALGGPNKAGASRAIATALSNLGMMYGNLQRPKDSEECHKRCLKIREAAWAQNPADQRAERELATCLNNFGALYAYIDRIAEAEQLYLRCLKINEARVAKAPGDATEKRQLAIIVNNLALLYVKTGRYRAAEPLYQRSLQAMEDVHGPDHLSMSTPLHNLGVLYRNMGRYDEAEACFVRSLAICEAKLGPNTGRLANDLYGLAAVRLAKDQPREALKLHERAMALCQANMEKIFAVSSERDMFSVVDADHGSVWKLITMALAGGKEEVGPALTWTLRRKGIIFDTLIRFRQAQELVPPGDPLSVKLGRYQKLQQILADVALNPPKAVSAEQLSVQKERWQKEADNLQAELHRAMAGKNLAQFTAGSAIDWSGVQKRLPPATALVEFVQYQPFDFKAAVGKKNWLNWQPARYAAFVLLPGAEAPTLLDLGSVDAIDKAVAVVREHIDQGQRLDADSEEAGETEYKTAAKALYQLIFAKIRPRLGKSAMIYLATDGELNRVPFEALVDERNSYLLENYRFAYQGCGRDLLRAKPSEPGQGTIVFAGPDYDLSVAQRQQKAKGVAIAAAGKEPVPQSFLRDSRGDHWKPLKGAAAEAKDVRDALGKSRFAPIEVFSGADALEENFKAVKSPRLLHVATHGFFLPEQTKSQVEQDEPAQGLTFGAARGKHLLRQNDNPLLRSGLVLAGANTIGDGRQVPGIDDGWVTAAEIALMDLRGTELVVLSACETGLGKVKTGEGVYGLRRAFMYAGASTLVTSLFSVPDTQTRELMKHFYGNLQKGQTKLDALHNAQIGMIGQRRQANGAAHPFFWASFVLVGDPN